MATASSGCLSTISPIFLMLEARTRPSTWLMSIIWSMLSGAPLGTAIAGPPAGPARLIGPAAVGGGGVDAVDQHGNRQALDRAAFADMALHRLGDLVVDRLLVAAALGAAAGGGLVGLRLGQVVGDGDGLLAGVA